MTTKRTIAEIARDVYRSANSWDSDARIIGNVTAAEMVELASEALSDDPHLDSSVFAHPAWWRGHDAGGKGVVKALTAMLDRGDKVGTFGSPQLEALAGRVHGLAAEREELRAFIRTAKETASTAEFRWAAIAMADGWDEVGVE